MLRNYVFLFLCLIFTIGAIDGARKKGAQPNALRIRNQYDVQYELPDGTLVRSGNMTDTLNYPYMAAVMVNGRLWCAGAIVDVSWVLTAAHCLNYTMQYELPAGTLVRSGKMTDTLNYPYMAAVMVNGRLWCAGAIVDVSWVFTAAHCLNYVLSVLSVKSLNRYVKVRVGSAKPHEGGSLIDVAGAVRHPKFEEEPVPHADVALLKLVRNLEFTKYVNLIRIYDGMREPFAQSFITVAGWGASSGSQTSFREQTSDLLAARLKVRSQQYCRDSYQLVNGFEFGQDMFCASLRNGTRDVCLFDAGAPAVQHNALMGILSFGPERCGAKQPAVFIKSFYFRDFVKETIVGYKTTGELIEAMKEVEDPLPPLEF